MNDVVSVRLCGHVEYDDALRAMRLHAQALRQKTDHDTLVLLEHPPIFTLGRKATDDDVLLTPAELADRGIEVHETDRGGEVTYHGPGQLVAYPIFNLAPDRKDVRKFVRSLEETMIRTCVAWGIEAERVDGLPGVWVHGTSGPRKIGAVGVHLSQWISTHGIALNVAPEMKHYDHIVPCGIKDKGVTSFALENKAATVREVALQLEREFAEVFQVRTRHLRPELRTVQVVVLREDGKVLALRRTMPRGGFWQSVTGRIDRGENTEQAAQRELFEETGATTKVHALDYDHDFPLDPGITRRDLVTVKWAHETGYFTVVPASFDARRSQREHDAHEWMTPAAAFERLPYAGLRAALRMAMARAPEIFSGQSTGLTA